MDNYAFEYDSAQCTLCTQCSVYSQLLTDKAQEHRQEPWCGWSVQQTATNRPDNNENQTAVLATEEYIAKEFSKLLENNYSSTCIAIPPTFEKGPDPDNLEKRQRKQFMIN